MEQYTQEGSSALAIEIQRRRVLGTAENALRLAADRFQIDVALTELDDVGGGGLGLVELTLEDGQQAADAVVQSDVENELIPD